MTKYQRCFPFVLLNDKVEKIEALARSKQITEYIYPLVAALIQKVHEDSQNQKNKSSNPEVVQIPVTNKIYNKHGNKENRPLDRRGVTVCEQTHSRHNSTMDTLYIITDIWLKHLQ